MIQRTGPQVCLLALLLGACTPPPLEEQPTPPDMKPLLDAYENPTGDFGQDQARELLGEAIKDLELVSDSAVFDLLFGAVDDALNADAQEQKPGLALRRQGLSLQGEGFVRITRVCPGWADGPPDEAANGSMRLTMNFNQEGIHPVVWGQAADCLYGQQDEQVELGGQLRIHLGSGSLGQLGSVPVLVQVEGLGINNRGLSLSDVDFRINPSTSLLEFRVSASAGGVVVMFEAGAVKVRAANGDFTCDLEAGTCTSPQSGTFSL